MPPHTIYPKVKRPSGFNWLEPSGCCSTICVSEDQRTVLKQSIHFHDGPEIITAGHQRLIKETAEFLVREKAIYQHLGPHPDILRVLEIREDGILFPYMRNGQVRDYLKANPELPPTQRQAWIESSIRSLAFVHSRDVMVADISARNFLVTDDCSSIILCDFSGSGLCDLKSMVGAEARYEKLGANGEYLDVTISSEIFSIGSLIYEIATGKAPYADLEDEQVKTKFSKRDFPRTDDILCGEVARGCWEGHYASCEEVLRAAIGHRPAADVSKQNELPKGVSPPDQAADPPRHSPLTVLP